MTAQAHVSNTTSNEGFNSENDVTCPRQRRWERSLLGKSDVRRLSKVISGTDYNKGLHVASHSCLRHERTITGGAYLPVYMYIGMYRNAYRYCLFFRRRDYRYFSRHL